MAVLQKKGENMKKFLLILGLMSMAPIGLASESCGQSLLCCAGREGYICTNATCTGEPPNQTPWACEYTPCSGGGGTGGPGGNGGGDGCDPNGGAYWVGCDPFAT